MNGGLLGLFTSRILITFQQKARENRAASRMQKAQQVITQNTFFILDV